MAADLGSQQRLQAAIICSCLDLDSQIEKCMSRAEERKLKEQFDRLRSVGILLASLMKREGG